MRTILNFIYSERGKHMFPHDSRKVRRHIAAFIAAVMICLLLFSAAAIAAEARHDCSGADCEICALVRTVAARISLSVTAALHTAGTYLLLCLCVYLCSCAASFAAFFSPITDKVRLNN